MLLRSKNLQILNITAIALLLSKVLKWVYVDLPYLYLRTPIDVQHDFHIRW